MALYFFDTHAHLQRSRGGRAEEIRDLLQRACNTGLRAVLVPAVDRADWDRLGNFAPVAGLRVYLAWGLHPYFVLELTPESAGDLVEELKFRVSNAPSNLKAIGECGLDFVRATDPRARELQVDVFRSHVELARETGLPLTIHCVKAHGPLIEILRERPVPPSAMHAFSGSAEVARTLVEAGHYISFAGNLCIPNARKIIDAARIVPEDRVLLETDTPDQTPPARRPAENEPAFIVDVAARLAEIRGVSLETIARTTLDNGRRVFAIDEPFDLD